MSAEITRARQRYPNLAVELFDFSGYGEYACERIPARGDYSATTRWYWEAGHFKKELGDIVLKRVFARDGAHPGDAEDPAAEVFGMRLEPADRAENRQRFARERAHCSNAYPEMFEEARALVASAKK